jgi:hypothetical protein
MQMSPIESRATYFILVFPFYLSLNFLSKNEEPMPTTIHIYLIIFWS